MKAVFWHEKGWALFQKLVSYMRYKQDQAGYKEINTPEILDRSLWEKSGHWEKFGANMYTSETPDQKIFAIKPMNCPGCVQVFNQGLKSYRDLPFKMSEFGKVHRYEPSGALHGLLRVRAFTQDDAHIFCTEDQITDECLSVTNLILEIYKDLGFENVILKYSDRPDLRVGEDEVWDKSEAALIKAIEASKLEYSINKGEGAFYGPKIEFVLRDAIGRDWQCGTLQVDLNLPERLGASFVDKDGSKKIPVMLHRALFGSLERFIGILIENYSGKLPFWISPLQTVVIPISEDFNEYAISVHKKIKNAGISCEVDLKNHNLNYKIREHSNAKVPMLLICEKKEVDSNAVTIRRLDSNKQENMHIDDFIKKYIALNKAPFNLVPDFKHNFFQRRNKSFGPRYNNRINSSEVQVIDSDGENLGILNTHDAISKAKNEGLDLIEIAPNAKPPVCKIMDIGKYKYDQQKKASKAKKNQKKKSS